MVLRTERTLSFPGVLSGGLDWPCLGNFVLQDQESYLGLAANKLQSRLIVAGGCDSPIFNVEAIINPYV